MVMSVTAQSSQRQAREEDTSGGSGGNILSLTIIPSGIVFGSLLDSGQFLAIGTFSSRANRERSDQLGYMVYFRAE